MTEQLALLQSVIENPADDLPRLIYADYLIDAERNPGPLEPERGEFIHAQVELARIDMGIWQEAHNPSSDMCWGCWIKAKGEERHYQQSAKDFGCKCSGKVTKLRRCERELSERYISARGLWNAPILEAMGLHPYKDDFDGQWYYTRGFISHVTCSWQDWLAHNEALYWQPERKCEVCGGGGRVYKEAMYRDVSYKISDDPITPPSHIYETDCSACRGRGVIPGATMECQCRGEYGEWNSGNCRYRSAEYLCDPNTGRIPRPIPPTAQPLEEVTLTTAPGWNRYDNPLTLRECAELWPGLKFNLPS